MSGNISLSQRMKDNYESRSQTYLIRRTPVICRLDGRAFHTLTKSMQKPYDPWFVEVMNKTAEYLCRNVDGVKLAFVASDEISILISDYDQINTSAWFDYNVQKMCSISAGIASVIFNEFLFKTIHFEITQKHPQFDSRVFNIPESEVINYFYWRQNDWTRNSISMLCSCYYSHKEMYGKNQRDHHDMLHAKGVNWNDYPTWYKRGRCIIKSDTGWVVDNEIPILTGDGRKYIGGFE